MKTGMSGKKINGRQRPRPTSKELFRSLRWGLVAMVSAALCFAGLSLLAGCGARPGPQQVVTPQTLRELQQPNPNRNMQQQILAQAPRAASVDYKDYQVGPEDQLVIEIFGQDELNREVRVNGQGVITLPLVGAVEVAGLTPQEIETRLMELYDADYLVKPQITVAVKEFRHQQVAVTGAVNKPGSYEIIGPRSLLEVLSLAGGIANDPHRAQAGDVVHVISRQKTAEGPQTAKTGRSQSFDPHTQTRVIDLRKLVNGQAPELNIAVHSGDVVHVPFATIAYVLGGVKKPGEVTVKQHLTVSQAVAAAGGIDPLLGTNDITVMRFDDQGRPITIETNLKNITTRKDPDIPLQGNDVVVVKIGGAKKTMWVLRQLLPIPSGSYALGY